MKRPMRLARHATALALLAGLGLESRDAQACGGLFCSAASPVNQAAERIVFAFDAETQTTTAVVEILYEGPAESFAWLLPVPGSPTIDVSSNALLNRLQQATNPNYQIQRTFSCDLDFAATRNGADFAAGGDGGTGTISGEVAGGGSVSVLDAGSVGPYDYTTIDVDEAAASDPAQEALDWLDDNGYDVTSTTADVLRPYLEDGMNLAAIRLTKQASTGSIRPIRLSYESERPMIPIRPTAVAANQNMGVMVWVLGENRAIPTNYKTLELNEALIDWFNPQQSYNDVVIAAANEAPGGLGFVTENARATMDPNQGSLTDQIFQERFQIENFRRSADGLSDQELILDVVQRFSVFSSFNVSGPFGAANQSGQVALDGVADVLGSHLVLPPGTSVDDVLASPACHLVGPETETAFYCDGQVAPAQTIDLSTFDRLQFLTDLEQLVFAPLEETAQLFDDFPYVTRFYTTLSPDEMLVDPEFDLNQDLPDVDNFHQVELRYQGCSTDDPWEATFADRVVQGQDNVWPLTLDDVDAEMPVNLRVLQLTTSGPGSVDEDNQNLIAQLLGTRFGSGGGDDLTSVSDSGGCTLSAGAPLSGDGAPWFLMAGLAAWGLRRRRG